jgi:hypothetical protein
MADLRRSQDASAFDTQAFIALLAALDAKQPKERDEEATVSMTPTEAPTAALSAAPLTPPWRRPKDVHNDAEWSDGEAWLASHGPAEVEGSAGVALGSYWQDDFGVESANDASYGKGQGRADVECSANDASYGKGQGRADVECSAGDAGSQEWQGHSNEDGSVEDAWYRDWQDPPDEEFASDVSDDEDEGRHEASSSAATARVLETHGQKRFRYVGLDEQQSLAMERVAAQEFGLRWQDRGPYAREGCEQPLFWRNQKYRPNSGKYSNNGGVNKRERALYYKWLANYRRGARKQEEDERFLPMLEAKRNVASGPFRRSDA